MKVIRNFRNDYFFLSNFYPSIMTFDGIGFTTAEHAYQAAKTNSLEWKHKIVVAETPAKAKQLGKKAPINPLWGDIRVGVMYLILKAKFKQNPNLAELLKDTGDSVLIEGNWWGDTFWGECNYRGENWLGKLLMQVREELRANVCAG